MSHNYSKNQFPEKVNNLITSYIYPFWAMFVIALMSNQRASAFQTGNVTTALGPTFFIDDASNGGGDSDFTTNTSLSFTRLFNGLLTPNQGPTRVTISGFGFATHTNAIDNDATSISVTFTYLGADGAVGGEDDVVVGSATGAFAFVSSASNPNAEYFFTFPTPLSADLTITATRFLIQITPSNGSGIALKLKTGVPSGEPSGTPVGPKLSVSGAESPLINPERVNLAKFQTVTSTSFQGQRLPLYMTDGVVGNDNHWLGSNNSWQSAVITFPFPVQVGSAQVFTGINDTNPISNYGLQFWNGTAWVNINGGSVSNNTNNERNLIFTSSVTSSSFRFISAESSLRVREIALYPPNGPGGYPLGTDVTLNLAYQRPTVASSSSTGSFALSMVDGRTANSSFWQTTTTGATTIEIDLRVSTRIGSAHIYSGTASVAPISDFVLKSWNGTTWQDITGASVTGNTTRNLVDSFTPVTTSRIRLEFNNPGTTAIREIMIFPANQGNAGYPIGTNVISSGAIPNYEIYNDSYYWIENSASGRRFSVPSNNQPALHTSGITLGQSQYQMLLNLSTGTYRLRNRATGQCLAGAQLSKTAGLPLTDTTYAALPHQDWLLDPIGGGNFRFINQWSGLVIDSQDSSASPGTLLVQNPANGSASQSWKIIKSEGFPKKGIGGTSFAMATNPNWAYNWGRTNTHQTPQDAIFHPMQWGNFNWDMGSNQGPLAQEYPSWRRRADGIHLMGFNEPDRSDQANMTMQQVISLWPRLQELDLPLVSPSPGTIGGEEGWLATYYAQANALGHRVDYTSVHTYPGPSGGSSNNLNTFVNNAYSIGSGRPVWLTEFSFVDWGKNQSWSEEDCYNCLAEFLWRAELNDNLRKYALFVFTEDDEWPMPANPWQAVTPAPRSNSYDRNGNLTAFGKLYAAWDGDTSIPPNTTKTYIAHNRGLRKRLANAATGNTQPGGRTIRVDGRLVNWSLVPTGASNRYFLVSNIDERRLSYSTASNPNADPTLAIAGTTGAAVEWTLTHNQHGWYFIEHPQTNTRLKMNSYNTSDTVTDYQMVANTVNDNNTQWRFITSAPQTTWTGASNNSWASTTNWTSQQTPTFADVVNFEAASTANLNTVLNQDISTLGIRIINPTGNVTIGGTNTVTIGSYGIDLTSNSVRNLTINAPIVLNASQSWTVANNRILTTGGIVTGNNNLSISGQGYVSFNASNVLPNGAGNRNIILNGNLNLNGTSQSINSISGDGTIDNLASTSATLTIGTDNTACTLPLTQNTSGMLSIIKIGTGSLTLPMANLHGGGLTNNGDCTIIAQNNGSFGTGPVVMNNGTLITSSANYTIANQLNLNGSILRVGGGNNRTLTWSGSITSTGNSSMNADGGTSGITLTGGLVINEGTFSSQCNGVANHINSVISGSAGTLQVSSGTLNVNAANTFTGNILVGEGKLIIHGNQPLATGEITVSANATLGGRGRLGGNATIANNGIIECHISTAAASHDPLDFVTGKGLTIAGASTLIITSTGGAQPGIYTLVTGGNPISGSVPTLMLPSGWEATAYISGNQLILHLIGLTPPGPLSHFAISSISSPQTIGVPIPAITITAQDATNRRISSFTGSVTFGGTGGFTGTSGNFVAGEWTQIGLTPTAAGTSLTLTVSDIPSSRTGSTTLTVLTLYQSWARSFLPADVTNPNGDFDGDERSNKFEYAFGTNPTSSANGSITYIPGGNVTNPGQPTTRNFGISPSVDYRAVFGRRKNHESANLIYTPQFSADLITWVNSSVSPTVLTAPNNTSAIEAVSVPFPALITTPNGPRKPTFFRIEVILSNP